jgi:hypothetical protein
MSARVAGLLAGALALGAAGCKSGSSDLCKRDADCAGPQACNEGACVTRLTEPQAWAVELVPRSESIWARTEIAMASFSPDPVALRVAGEEIVNGSIQPLDDDASVGVILSIPSSIGLPDRTFEAQSGPAKNGVATFSVAVPASSIGRPATVRITPAAPADRVLPSWSVAVPMLAAKGLIVNVLKSDELNTIEGVLQNSTGDQVITGYAVKAVVSGKQVSSSDKTNEQGRFNLRLPMSVTLAAVRVGLDPTGESVMPSLVAALQMDKLNLGMLRLPPLGKTQAVDVPVVGMDTGKKLASVTLRFYAPLTGALGGNASVRREVQTDKEGVAHGQLMVGAAGEPVTYAVAAIPGTDSVYGARCMTHLSISSAVGRTDPIELPPRAELAGKVVDALNVPQKGVAITATRKDSTFAAECDTDIGTLQTTATTAADGTYRLLLDPGTYRLQYEPAAATASPLFSEDPLMVNGSVEHDVMLPAGVLADGVVRTSESDDMPASGCEVRLYRITAGSPPELRARARTGADGHFRIVLPQAQ